MLYSEIIAVCSEIHTKHINTLCGQNVEFVNVKPGGTYSDQLALEGNSNSPRHAFFNEITIEEFVFLTVARVQVS
jgi:hypothetical protein